MRALLGWLPVVALAACTSATVGDPAPVDDLPEGPDAGVVGDDPPDEPDEPAPVTLSQSVSDVIAPQNSVGCIDQSTTPAQHKDNSYYRVFDLAAAGVPGDLEVEYVQIGVEEATSPTGSQPATLSLYTLGGTFLVGNLQVLATTSVTIQNQAATLNTMPIATTVPAGSKLVVELFVPDSAGQGRLFFIGSNAVGQTAPSFLRANVAGCDVTEPTDLAALGFPGMHIVMKVVGRS
jgi:hypothetical protein